MKAEEIQDLMGYISRLEKENDMLDEVSTYWKEQFDKLYNMVFIAIHETDSDSFTDGEVVDQIAYYLEKSFAGQSDGQRTNK